jgi:hypothetical protein
MNGSSEGKLSMRREIVLDTVEDGDDNSAQAAGSTGFTGKLSLEDPKLGAWLHYTTFTSGRTIVIGSSYLNR